MIPICSFMFIYSTVYWSNINTDRVRSFERALAVSSRNVGCIIASFN